jgi:uncharacterized protein (TIGR02266 family)
MSDMTPDTPLTPVQPSQRKNLRSPLITLKIRMDDEKKFFFGYTKNLSRSGMFVATLKPLRPDQQIRVEMPLPDPLKFELRCTCEVVWVRSFNKKSTQEPGVGLKFIDLDEATAVAIDNWVQARR